MVRRREFDAAIVTDPQVSQLELEVLPITIEPLVVIAPPDSKARDWREALTSQPFLRVNRLSGMGALIGVVMRNAGLTLFEAMDLDSSDVVLSMVHAGLGAGVTPAGGLKGEYAEGVRSFPFGEPPVNRRVVLIERLNHVQTDLSQVLYLELKRLTETEHG
jgi:DNA-binding transcriptional LysR family regulator